MRRQVKYNEGDCIAYPTADYLELYPMDKALIVEDQREQLHGIVVDLCDPEFWKASAPFQNKECTRQAVMDHLKRCREKGDIDSYVLVQWDTGRISLAPKTDLTPVLNGRPVKPLNRRQQTMHDKLVEGKQTEKEPEQQEQPEKKQAARKPSPRPANVVEKDGKKYRGVKVD